MGFNMLMLMLALDRNDFIGVDLQSIELLTGEGLDVEGHGGRGGVCRKEATGEGQEATMEGCEATAALAASRMSK